MTKEQLTKAFELRVDGLTYDEIAEHMGVSRQAVHEALHRAMDNGRVYAKCVYPGLRRWMIDHNISRRQLALALRPGVKPGWLYYKLEGRFRLSMGDVKAILKYTGMTFEEAFGEEEQDGTANE